MKEKCLNGWNEWMSEKRKWVIGDRRGIFIGYRFFYQCVLVTRLSSNHLSLFFLYSFYRLNSLHFVAALPFLALGQSFQVNHSSFRHTTDFVTFHFVWVSVIFLFFVTSFQIFLPSSCCLLYENVKDAVLRWIRVKNIFKSTSCKWEHDGFGKNWDRLRKHRSYLIE